MKKLLIILMALTLVGGFATASFAGIANSKHDFSSAAWNAAQEICNVCHVPHKAAYPTDGPLWNHMLSSETYTVYSSPGGTLNATVGNPPVGVSKLCLGCHDGTVALEAFGGTTTGSNYVTGNASLGTNLKDDHPVSFTYDSALAGTDGKLTTPSGGKVGGLPLYGAGNDQLECATCHDVHGTGVGDFLRISNAKSALCLLCHLK